MSLQIEIEYKHTGRVSTSASLILDSLHPSGFLFVEGLR